MSGQHLHRRITKSGILSNPHTCLKVHGHSANNLGDLVISSSKHRGSTLTDLQKTALHNFRNKPEFDLREDVTL
jgi:hypothetical protein